jgi:glycosyltransferase involved in cell wall biosynthesis
VYEPGPNTLLVSGPLGARLALEARRLARRSDVVVGVTAPTASLWAAGALTRRSGAGVVAMPLVHLDGEAPRRWVLRMVRRCDAVSANSGVERDWLVARGVPAARVRVLPPGCEPDRYPDLSPADARAALGLPDAPTVGFVGRLAAHKGVDVLVSAMRSVWAVHPDARLLVAGHEAGADLQGCLDALPAHQRGQVHVWGPFEDEERALLLAASDVVAHPSRSESFGMVTVEAWCARRPVVVADIDVTRTLVRDGTDGRLVAVGDPAALAAALSSLLDDESLRRSYGAAGRARAEREFSWDVVVAGWAELLQDARAHVRARAA